MREITLDTETTGLNPSTGDRVVEIGCLELSGHVPTGETFHTYLNPEREMPEGAFAVHGLSDNFLAGQPLFADRAADFLAFIGDDPLVIHNADFDLGFLNMELERAGLAPLAVTRAIDTVTIARAKFPGQKASLDALCRRFNIDNSHRELHGALKDAELLAEVYLELKGGRQQGLGLSGEPAAPASGGGKAERAVQKSATSGASGVSGARAPRPHAPTDEERAAHAVFLEKIKDPLWSRAAE